MSATETTDIARDPGTTVVVYGSDYLAASVVGVWLTCGWGIESRLVAGTWEHRFYAPRKAPAPEREPMVSTDPDTPRTWFVWKWIDDTHRELMGTETHTDRELEAWAEEQGSKGCLEYRCDGDWRDRKRHLRRLDLHEDGVVYERLDDKEGAS